MVLSTNSEGVVVVDLTDCLVVRFGGLAAITAWSGTYELKGGDFLFYWRAMSLWERVKLAWYLFRLVNSKMRSLPAYPGGSAFQPDAPVRHLNNVGSVAHPPQAAPGGKWHGRFGCPSMQAGDLVWTPNAWHAKDAPHHWLWCSLCAAVIAELANTKRNPDAPGNSTLEANGKESKEESGSPQAGNPQAGGERPTG